MTEFRWKGITFVVKRTKSGITIFRDKRHLGGKWTEAWPTIRNTSLHRNFRTALTRAALEVEKELDLVAS
jgi:hypothetical protein